MSPSRQNCTIPANQHPQNPPPQPDGHERTGPQRRPQIDWSTPGTPGQQPCEALAKQGSAPASQAAPTDPLGSASTLTISGFAASLDPSHTAWPNPLTTDPAPGSTSGGGGGSGGTSGGTSGGGVVLQAGGLHGLYRRMLADPTLALARASVMGPILSAGWAVAAREDAPSGAQEMVERQLDPIRTLVLRDCLRALDYGWAAFEKVWTVGRTPGSNRREVRLAKLKPLLVDLTRVVVERQSGRFAGLFQPGIYLPASHSLLYSYDREGDELYGRSRLENCRAAWMQWLEASKAAEQYDRKVAGVFVMVHYPDGKSYGPQGQLMDNYQIARGLARSLSAGNPIVVPRGQSSVLSDEQTDNGKSWIIELLEDRGGRQGSFIERLRYLDSLKLRGYLKPERSLLEAGSGTRADADTHHQAGLADSELLYADILRHLNWYLVDPLLEANFGCQARGSVWLEPAPLRRERLQHLAAMLQHVMHSPEGNRQTTAMLDLPAVMDLLEIPRLDEPVTDSGHDGTNRSPQEHSDEPASGSSPPATNA